MFVRAKQIGFVTKPIAEVASDDVVLGPPSTVIGRGTTVREYMEVLEELNDEQLILWCQSCINDVRLSFALPSTEEVDNRLFFAMEVLVIRKLRKMGRLK